MWNFIMLLRMAHNLKKELLDLPGGLAVRDPALLLQCYGFDPWPRELLYSVGTQKTNKQINKKTQMSSGIFYLIFSELSWSQIPETSENKIADKGERL